MSDLRTAAQQALEALMDDCLVKVGPHSWERRSDLAITALKSALAEPENWELRRLREELDRCKQTCAATSEAWREEAALAQRKPLTIERLRDALVASRIIPPAAVEDPDEYDDGVTLFRIEALHRRIT